MQKVAMGSPHSASLKCAINGHGQLKEWKQW